MASSMPRRFPPSFPVTPPKACAALWYKRRRGDTELCGALAGWPSPPPAGALSPAGSGDAAQWAASITDRRGSGDQALNGAHWAPAPPKGGGETWLSLRGRYVPVGRCPAADRGGSRDAGTAAAVTERVSCQPHRPLPWLSPLRARAPRSLVPFWLRAHKVKGKVAAF